MLLFDLGCIAGLFHELLECKFVDLHVLLDHHLLEGLKVVDVEDLLDDAVVGRIAGRRLTCRLELLPSDAHLGD